MTVLAAVWSLMVATVYALLYTASPAAANQLVMFFVVAVLLPAVTHDLNRRQHKRRRPR